MGRGLVDTKNIASGLARYAVQLFCYQLMPNHWQLVGWPTQDGELSQFRCWVTMTHTVRYHAHLIAGVARR